MWKNEPKKWIIRRKCVRTLRLCFHERKFEHYNLSETDVITINSFFFLISSQLNSAPRPVPLQLLILRSLSHSLKHENWISVCFLWDFILKIAAGQTCDGMFFRLKHEKCSNLMEMRQECVRHKTEGENREIATNWEAADRKYVLCEKS